MEERKTETKKPNIFARIRKWWDEQDKIDKAYYKGMVVGGISAAIGATASAMHLQNKRDKAWEDVVDFQGKELFSHGFNNGQIHAYQTMLNDPIRGFQNMGFKQDQVKKF